MGDTKICTLQVGPHNPGQLMVILDNEYGREH
jgi:hypothetical protein